MEVLAQIDHRAAISASRVALLSRYIDYLDALDETTEWAEIVKGAREAGVEKDQFRERLSCSWSTVTRWMAGAPAPGPSARGNIKRKLIAMIAANRDSEVAYRASGADSLKERALTP